MSGKAPETCPALKSGFTWYEKLLTRAALGGLVCLGLIGIYLKSPTAAGGYLVFAMVGGLLVIYDFLCVYCPYPYEHADCLFFPAPLLTGIARRRSGRIHRVRKALLLLTAGGLVLIPQYWLWGNWGMLAGFWVLAALVAVVFLLYYCRRCRHGQCPLNRAASVS